MCVLCDMGSKNLLFFRRSWHCHLKFIVLLTAASKKSFYPPKISQQLKQIDIITHYMSKGWVVNIMRKSYEKQLISFSLLGVDFRRSEQRKSRGKTCEMTKMCRHRLFSGKKSFIIKTEKVYFCWDIFEILLKFRLERENLSSINKLRLNHFESSSIQTLIIVIKKSNLHW